MLTRAHRGFLLVLLTAGLGALLGACIVEGRCFADVDCPGQQICVEGACQYECSGDDECPDCRRCVPPRSARNRTCA